MKLVICVAFALLGCALAQAPAKSPNFRSDYDKFLFAFVEEHTFRAEEKLYAVQQEFYEYQTKKDAALKAKILLDIDRELPILQETALETQNQLKRTDFSDFERYMVEKLSNDVALLITHFNHIRMAVSAA